MNSSDGEHIPVSPSEKRSHGEHGGASEEATAGDIEPAEEGKGAKAAMDPGNPTISEIRGHQLTHIPFRSWCPACARGK